MSDRPLLRARQTHERPHVLVVSDDGSLVDFLSEGLPLGGFWVSVIASGLQALEVFRLRRFDIVLVDAGLQSFNPAELVRRLRGKSTRTTDHEPRTTAPLVVVTEGDAPFTDDERADLQVVDVLQAPLELDEVARRLHAVFADWRQANPDVPLADAANLSR